MADLATLQTRLLEAELAYHRLLTGVQEVEVNEGDIGVKYANSVTGLQKLEEYIQSLKAQIADAGGEPHRKRRALEVDL